jgi:hypothetical protein
MQPSLPYDSHKHNNRGLFADNYLDNPERLQAMDEWKHVAGVEEAFRKIAQLYDRATRFNNRTNEAQTENDFIQPVLNLLWGKECYQVQAIIPNADGWRQTDYAFFRSAADRQAAQPRLGLLDYWRDVPCLGDAKKWTASLDKVRGADENPSAQISNYLYRSRVRWGILTNGRVWRLYEREKSSAGGIYYEVNLEELLYSGNLEAFKYFYLFFRREAFLPDQSGVSFVEKVFQGSVGYATEVGDRLKESVYDALRLLMDGFFEYTGNGLDRADLNVLKEVHENALIVLYRLLFLLYAEDKGLLPLDDPIYHDHSLKRLHQEINENLRERRTYLPAEHRFWPELTGLFELIDNGLPHEGKYVIPAYNGGLFSPAKYPYIAHTSQPGVARWEIGDHRLAEVIDMLAYQRERWNEPGTQDIDYNTLDVQHLGSIYEGLLELQPHIANESLVETIEDGKPVFKPAREAPNPRPSRGQPPRTVNTGEVYLITNRGERKATGSYYTPKYIVDYIVQNTLDPLVDEAAKKVAQLRPEVDKEIAKLQRTRRNWEKSSSPDAAEHIAGLNRLIEEQKRRLLEPYLSLKILDPAMGSGHFLVGAADFLSLAMTTDPNMLLLESVGDEDPQMYYKRLVVERCLYGVDLNPLAVELAKLSLWLHTVSKDKALSFLDHHLRCGNSLIGARIEDDLATTPPELDSRGRVKKRDTRQLVLGFTETLTATHLHYLLDTFRKIMEAPTGDAETERMKDRWYREMDAARDKYRAVANIWLAPYFGVQMTPEHYAQAVNALRGTDADWQSLIQQSWFQIAQAVAQSKRFFHWELEFPEIFFDAHGFKPSDERGFDAVIGNPPYDELSEDARGSKIDEMPYLQSALHLSTAIGYRINLYRLFVAQALDVLRCCGWHGFIVPLSLLADQFSLTLRKSLLERAQLKIIEQFPQKDDPHDRVFIDAKLSTCLYAAEKKLGGENSVYVRTHPGRDIREDSMSYSTYQLDFYRFDPLNVSIPGISQQAWTIVLALATGDRFSRLGEFAEALPGELMINSQFAGYLTDAANGEEIIRGSHIGLYELVEPKQGESLYLNRQKYLSEHTHSEKAFHHKESRVVYQRYAAIDNYRRLIATVLPKGYFCSHTVGYLANIKKYEPAFFLALLNSTLLDWRFNLTSTNNNVNGYEVEALPIPRIDFTTPPDERARLLEKGKRLHDRCLAKRDNNCMLGFVEHHLEQSPEQADVVHDLLAFLAEQMIEMNKKKQAEVKGFLTWLEREIDAKIDDLSNKTKLRAYHEHDFEALLDVLRQNRRKLSVNPDTRSIQEATEREFNQSMTKLGPLKAKIAATDRLIDLVVYRLYGLTEEEIAIVEGSIPGRVSSAGRGDEE